MKKESPEVLMTRSRLRAIQYQHIDGTFELTFGGASLLMAVSFFVTGRITTANSFISNNLLPFIPLVVFSGGVYLIDFLIQRLRMRVTYQRTGFISYQKPQPLKQSIRLVIWIGIPVITVLLLGLIILNRPMFQTVNQNDVNFLTPSFFGLMFSGLWAIIGWKIAIPRFYIIAAVSFLVSVLLFLNRVGGNPGMALLFSAMGSGLCVSGGLTLLKYLRKNPVPQEKADGQ